MLPSFVDWSRLPGASVAVELQSAFQNVAGDVGGTAARCVGVGAQPDQGLGGFHLQLSDEHPVAWLTSARLNAFSSAQALLLGSPTAACKSPSIRSSSGTPASSAAATALAKFLVRQVAGLRAEEVQGTDIFACHQDGYRVDASDLIGQHGRPVRGPSNLSWIREVDDQDRDPLRHRLQARSLAKRELQFVVGAGVRAARSQCSAARAFEDERDGRRVNIEQNHAGLAQPVGGLYPTPTVDGRE